MRFRFLLTFSPLTAALSGRAFTLVNLSIAHSKPFPFGPFVPLPRRQLVQDLHGVMQQAHYLNHRVGAEAVEPTWRGR